jgi:4-hydroxy-4-methyl-2-oxoglutarate aldolase
MTIHEDRELVDHLGTLGVATVHEAYRSMGGFGLLSARFSCLPDGAACTGRAATALLAEGDNLAVHRLLEVVDDGDVMILQSTGASGTTGMCGELVALAARALGVRGIVAHGSVRDLGSLRAVGLPIWFRNVDPAGGRKGVAPGIRVPLAIGGVVVRPDSWVVADADGVLVVAPEHVAELYVRASRRAEAESRVRELLVGADGPGAARRLGELMLRARAELESSDPDGSHG